MLGCDKLKIYIGYDQRDDKAFEVAKKSILTHAPDVEIVKLTESLARQAGFARSYRVDKNGQMWDDIDKRPFSTQFSFTRFCVPILEDYREGWVLFMDADMMLRTDITQVLNDIDPDKSIMCVKHNYSPSEKKKMGGLIQSHYNRKNWSSFMLMNPSKCRSLTIDDINSMTGRDLHSLEWAGDIGELSSDWNFLVGHSTGEPKNVHFTQGTPDMPFSIKSEWDREWWDYFEAV